MLSALFFTLLFLVPLLLFLIGQLPVLRERARQSRREAPPERERAPRERLPRRSRRARSRPAPIADCGRASTHLLLMLVGARNSCRHCLQLPEANSAAEAVAAAERIINEANE